MVNIYPLSGESFNEIVSKVGYENSSGYAGMKTEEYLKQVLKFQLGQFQLITSQFFNLENEITRITNETLLSVNTIVQLPKSLHIYIFPANNTFVNEHMNGCCGFAPWKDVIHIYFNPTLRNSFETLKETIVHECSHILFYQYHNWNTLLDSLIAEGLAELFTQEILQKTTTSEFARALNDKEIISNWQKIKQHLQRNDMHNEVFFGVSEKFKNWTGYTIGFEIVKEFREQNKNMQWSEIIKLTPSQIMNEVMKTSRRFI